ncbi:methylenetetrahydrofolate reductase [NAD(P)H] [Stappia taiwanensis]|uniref:Methylenetetrahydrofolate reductase n=1 Tax=Stappia taiwanensis TaxID=992267 RepID=A0A838XVP1_9HYPH|nr:methylenetetrahydrofolate reductase [NAD(P)H] [Stappia taiwanensis]MBA4611124.1 methylenetetrahydrofolate reductase [NAD(P)H] [Stappia taiwanensis]GGE86163.1 methylenetetrahydrofolate reductase [Stappia taiwanensis]
MTSPDKIRRFELGNPGAVSVSFEFFPPKSDKMEAKLWSAVERLQPLDPSFVSVTYGAGGSTRERTHRTVSRLLKETAMAPAAHLTCVGASRGEIDEIVREYADLGVRHIVALRGDPLEGIGAVYRPREDGYAYASDLVEGIRRVADFEVSVSAYPERHPESADWSAEIDNLKRKVDAGATRAITQYFFDNDLFETFLEKVRAAGISIPIVPGILPITNFEQTMVFSAKCGTSIPHWLARRFAGLEQDSETRKLVASAVACEQVLDLVDRGITDFHFYTMNRADLTFAICHMLGVRPATSEQQAA